MSARRLDLEFVRARRLERDLSSRDVADAVGMSQGTWRRLEGGLDNARDLTFGQLNKLANVLGVRLDDLLADADATAGSGEVVAADCSDKELVRRLGALLVIAGRGVAVGTLAEVLQVTTAEVDGALRALTPIFDAAGITVSCTPSGVAAVPSALSLRDGAVRALVRRAEDTRQLPVLAARLLHRVARGDIFPKTLRVLDRQPLAVLLRGQWLIAPVEGTGATVRLHDDVRFSLALDEGHELVRTVASIRVIPTKAKRFQWLSDGTDSPPGPAPG